MQPGHVDLYRPVHIALYADKRHPRRRAGDNGARERQECQRDRSEGGDCIKPGAVGVDRGNEQRALDDDTVPGSPVRDRHAAEAVGDDDDRSALGADGLVEGLDPGVEEGGVPIGLLHADEVRGSPAPTGSASARAPSSRIRAGSGRRVRRS